MKSDKSLPHFIDFLNTSPTPWHAIKSIVEMLQSSGYNQLFEEETWLLKPNSKYFCIRNGSSLCAFITPNHFPKSIRILGSHTDSPGLKLKPNAEFKKENLLMLGLEVYGSPLITSWFNRDLGIAGRITYVDLQGNIKSADIKIENAPVVIPQLAIHLDRSVNENGLMINKQNQLAAIAKIIDPDLTSDYWKDLITPIYPDFVSLLSHDLFLFPLEKANFLGKDQQMIASYRIDNLSGVFASISSLISTKTNSNDLKIAVLWDNEEIGSETAQGAGSPFLLHLLERVCLSYSPSREDFLSLLRRSLCLSVDLAHATHPNYSDKHEPNHLIKMGGGIVLKYNAQQRYATDASSASSVVTLCQKEKIPFQHFVTRGDIPCGTTIGPIHSVITGISTVDIGIPQLSMHSAREILSCKDFHYLCQLLSAFLKFGT